MLVNTEKLIDILNALVKNLDPITFDEFNTTLTAVDQDGLLLSEKEFDQIGIKLKPGSETEFCSSTAALIATITDVLVGKRLAFIVDDDTGVVTGFQWYKARRVIKYKHQGEPTRICSCGQEIFFVKNEKTGRPMPVSMQTLETHFADCPDAAKFRKKFKTAKRRGFTT